MDYFDMIDEAKKKGLVTQDKMWESLTAMYDILAMVEEEHPKEYWKMMREQHELMYGKHYDEAFANHDVSKIHYTGRDGVKRTGAHWTKDEILEATKNFQFPASTTDCDKYVAFNSFYADLCQVLDDEQIIKGAFQFYFKDEDGPQDGGKIWRYMYCMKCK